MDSDLILQFFAFSHLPEPLQQVSRPFHALAMDMKDKLPPNAERSIVFRKLLEAKDAAVRSAIMEAGI